MEDFYDKTAEEKEEQKAPETKESVSVAPPKTMAYSVICLILSLMSIVCCCTGFISLLFAAVALVFSLRDYMRFIPTKKKNQHTGPFKDRVC